jgi:hypothetical protein
VLGALRRTGIRERSSFLNLLPGRAARGTLARVTTVHAGDDTTRHEAEPSGTVRAHGPTMFPSRTTPSSSSLSAISIPRPKFEPPPR